MIRLGLIGGNIATSRSPMLHRECGRLHGLQVSYELMIPADLGLDFDRTFDRCRELGFDGFNVTLPYKEEVLRRVTVADPLVAQIGAVNTVRLTPGGAEGFNTDHSGFFAAFRAAFDFAPGRVALIGAGGVGKAIGFALVALGAEEIRVIDKDKAKADGLALALGAAGGRAAPFSDTGAGMDGAEGAVNCTPLGMHGYPGSPVHDADFRGKVAWAFDAVYTPEHTLFRAQAQAAGAKFLSGWELFFWQGVQAFEIFTGVRPTRLAELRARLLETA